jgi:tetratricopeptide (TPR) repeat protein
VNPEIRGIWGELGVAQSELGQEADAEASLAKAHQEQPNADSTWKLEAMISAAHRDWPAANQRLLALSERSPEELQKVLALWPQKLIPGVEVKGAVWQCLRQSAPDCSLPAGPAHPHVGLSAKLLFDEERWAQIAVLSTPAENNAEEWFWHGLAFARLGDCARAIPALERGLPTGAETAASWLTYCYELSAVRAADELKSQGDESAVHEIRGDILLSIRLDAEQAVAEYKEALTVNPKNPELLKKVAQAYFSQGNMQSAGQSAEEALALTPHRIELLKLLAQVAMSERDYPSALSRLSQLAQVEPEDAWVRVQQGTAYAQTGHPDQAVELLKSALNAGYSDERGALHFLLSVQLRKLGRDQEARTASDEAAKLADAFQQQTQGRSNTPQ